MRGERFLEKFSLIDEKFIEEAEEKPAKKSIKIPIIIAACFMLVLLAAALPFLKKETPPSNLKVHNAVDTTELPVITYTPSPVYDGIPYSELNISDTGYDSELDNVDGIVMADIAPFYEEYVADCVAVVKGRVKDVRLKQYEFTTDFDKFKTGNGTLHRWNTVIYEIEVEEIYKGKLDTEVLTIEDTILFDQMFYLKQGHRYVIPLVTADDNVAHGLWQGKITEGSAKRESVYHSSYPYCPPIECTKDGYYLFPNVWTTLAYSDDAVRVTMDIPYDAVHAYYNDKMMLIDSVNFEKLFEEILTKYNKQG